MMRGARGVAGLLSILGVLCWVSAAGRLQAQGTPPAQGTLSVTDAAGNRPWAEGVTQERQALARSYFEKGNVLLRESVFVQAAAMYKEALSAWDHPGIHYNLALALINLDQPLEVHAHLQSAMRYGPGPLEADKFEYAHNYLTLIEKQLATIRVRCDDLNASVQLDGNALFEAPGMYEGLVRPGAHTLTAAKSGYETTQNSAILLPGKIEAFQLKLYKTSDLIAYRRRWPVWPTILTTALGAAVVGVGAVLSTREKAKLVDYDAAARARPDTEPASVSDLKSTRAQSDRFHKAAIASYAIGGAVMATGIVLMIVNRSRPFRVDPAKSDSFSLTPFAGAHAAGVLGTRNF